MQVRITPCLSKSAPVWPKTKTLRTSQIPSRRKHREIIYVFTWPLCCPVLRRESPWTQQVTWSHHGCAQHGRSKGSVLFRSVLLAKSTILVQCFCTVTTFELLLTNKLFQTTVLVMGWVWKSGHHYYFLLTECRFLEWRGKEERGL